MSPAEVRLWGVLRQRPSGLKFRPQHPAGPYTADFFCHAAQIVVEVDGEAHNRGDRPERDTARDAWFARQGVRVLRFSADDVFRNLDGVVRQIEAVAASSSPHHHSHAANGSPLRGSWVWTAPGCPQIVPGARSAQLPCEEPRKGRTGA